MVLDKHYTWGYNSVMVKYSTYQLLIAKLRLDWIVSGTGTLDDIPWNKFNIYMNGNAYF